ncbi:MAG TPA: helix-turn-helix domain-containing protein [Candidatus Eisenbacteria bacterium]|nr:helix-turn-helix domain-containing protein [Candidatus Eisenbacteria bacterium]
MRERFLTLSEVRAMLKVSRATLWRWANERGLKTLCVGDVVRIRESDLQAFLKRHETTGADAVKVQAEVGEVQPAEPRE